MKHQRTYRDVGGALPQRWRAGIGPHENDLWIVDGMTPGERKRARVGIENKHVDRPPATPRPTDDVDSEIAPAPARISELPASPTEAPGRRAARAPPPASRVSAAVRRLRRSVVTVAADTTIDTRNDIAIGVRQTRIVLVVLATPVAVQRNFQAVGQPRSGVQPLSVLGESLRSR